MSKPIAVLGLVMTLLFLYQSFAAKQGVSTKPRDEDRIASSLGKDERSKSSPRSGSAFSTLPSLPKASPETKPNASATAEDKAPSAGEPAENKISDSSASDRNISASPVSPPLDTPGVKPMKFDIQSFGIDEILALPMEEKLRFLEKNQLREPNKIEQFRYLPDATVMDKFLKGTFKGKFEAINGKQWTLALTIDGQVEGDHFNGELAVELFNAQDESVARSTTQGPLEEHVRLVEEGNRNSLLISPNIGSENAVQYQVFIGQDNRTALAGNFYEKNKDGVFELSGPFVLKRSGSVPNN